MYNLIAEKIQSSWSKIVEVNRYCGLMELTTLKERGTDRLIDQVCERNMSSTAQS